MAKKCSKCGGIGYTLILTITEQDNDSTKISPKRHICKKCNGTG